MFLTSQHNHWDKDCNNYMLVSRLVEHKLQLCYGVPTAQERWVLAMPGMSLQMACGLQGGHVNILSLWQRQKRDRDTAFDTQTVLNSVCRGPWSFRMALGATTDTIGRKTLPTEFYMHNHKDG